MIRLPSGFANVFLPVRRTGRFLRTLAAALVILSADSAIGQATDSPNSEHVRERDWVVETTRQTDMPTGRATTPADADGRWRNALPVLSGLMGGVLVVILWWSFVGIDLRRRTRALEESGLALRQILIEKDSILDNALVGILLVEGERLIACNRRFGQMAGYREGELRGIDPSSMFFPWPVPPGGETPGDGGTGELCECRLIDRSGRTIWVEVSVTMVNSPHYARRHVLVVVDVDARRRAELEQRAAEERFRATFDSTRFGIALLDPSGRIIELNPTACAAVGLSCEAARGLSLWQLPGFAESRAERRAIRRAHAQVQGGRCPRVLARLRGGDHQQRTIVLTLSPARGFGQLPNWIVAEAADVTAYRTARQALCKLAVDALRPAAGDLLASLVEHASRALAMRRGFIVELPEDGRLARVSADWQDGRPGVGGTMSLAGTPLAEIVGTAPVIHADGACRRFPQDPAIQRLQARAYWAVSLPDEHGVPLGFLVVLSDQAVPVSSEARAFLSILAGRAAGELRRRRDEAPLRIAASALEQSRQGICIADRNRCIVIANTAGAALCGRTAASLKGQLLPRLGGDDYGARSLGEVLDIADRSGSWQGEVWIRGPGGDKLPLWLSANRIRQDGSDYYAVLFFDNTQRKQAEFERLELESKLQQVQRMESVGHLAGGIAHDFNNILTVIGGFTTLVRQAAERQPKMVPGYLDEIALATRRARDLVAQLLAFSRNERQAPEAIMVAPIVEEAGQLFRASLPVTVELDVRVPSGLPDVSIRPGQLHQVVMNLALNARDALGDRGRILITAARYRVDALRSCDSCHRHFAGDFVALMVQDNGHGIPAEVRAKIFDPFFTTKPLGQGNGLGLSVIHGVVHGAGGHLEVASAEGAGTTFRVLLPVAAPADPGGASVLPCAASGEPAPARIMLVDDDPATVQYAAELLVTKGHAVHSFTDPRKALLALHDAPRNIDLLIADRTMPHLSGEDLAQSSRLLRTDLPVILCAGFGEQIDAPHAARLGIRHFLLKPLHADALLRAVRESLAAVD